MSNALADARQRLAGALEAVLPGRVSAYPLPNLARHMAPFVWIDQTSGQEETAGTATRVLIVTYPVRLAVDGADHAQVALLDDLQAQVWDACSVRGMQPRAWSPRDTTIDGGLVLRGSQLNVAVTITARSLCSPVATPVVMPPQPVEVN